MILLWGLGDEGPLRAVHQQLMRLEAEVFLLDQERFPAPTVALSVDGEVRGCLRAGEAVIDLDQVSAAYLRPYPRSPSSVAQPNGDDELLWSWADLAPIMVLNRPSAMASNASKPFQSAMIRSVGFDVPETLVTTDPEAAEEFWSRHGTVVYKSVSGARSIVSRLSNRHRARLGDVAWCPTQFQAYIPGVDHRVHVVGGELFVAEVATDVDDYRYAGRQGGSVDIRPGSLPEDCADRCRALASAMDLPVAGIDLRRAPDGRWYCFEVNPSPAFTYYEHGPDSLMATAIARLLHV